MKKSKVVSPEEAARRVRHLLFGQDTMVMMATGKATHYYGHTRTIDISRKGRNVIAIHGESGDCYVGNFIIGFGLCDVQFPKTDCALLTEDEVKNLEGSRKVVGSFPC